MNCVVIDPNARGDRIGMETFEISIRGLFEQQESNLTGEEDGDDDSTSEREMSAVIPADDDGSIYVLAHSAAGGQLVRYLLDQQENAPLLSRIRCITFTDSTHSVQWLKKHPHISSLIQSSKALYVRSANPMRDDEWENASPGDECPQDHFWSHRFGAIKTVWAGKERFLPCSPDKLTKFLQLTLASSQHHLQVRQSTPYRPGQHRSQFGITLIKYVARKVACHQTLLIRKVAIHALVAVEVCQIKRNQYRVKCQRRKNMVYSK